MVRSAGEGMQIFGDALFNLGLLKKEREDEAYITDIEVQVSRGATDLLSKLNSSKWQQISTPDGTDRGSEQIQSWLQTHKDQAEMIGQYNPALGRRYKNLIARAEIHADGAYQRIKDEKFKDYDAAALLEALKLKGDSYQYASTDDERTRIMTDAFDAINKRAGGTIPQEKAFLMKNQWAAQTHEAYIFAQINKMPAELSLGSIDESNKFLDKMLDPLRYPFLTPAMANHVRENFKSKLFTQMDQVNKIIGNESDRALLTTLKFLNANPQAFKTPGELQGWIDAQGDQAGMGYMKNMKASDLLTSMRVQQQPPPTDYQALIPVMAGNSSWEEKKRKVLALYRDGKIGGPATESHVARIDSHIDAERNRAAALLRDPVQDPAASPYLHIFSVLSSDVTTDLQTKLAASAATISFFDLLRGGMPMDAAFVKAASENRLKLSPAALPQVPVRYQHDDPAMSAKLLLDGFNKGDLTQAEYEKNVKRLKNIKDIVEFRKWLLNRAKAAEVKKAPQSGAASSMLLHDITGFILGAEPGVLPDPAKNFELYGGF